MLSLTSILFYLITQDHILSKLRQYFSHLKLGKIRKITRRTTGARGYKFELFQSFSNYVWSISVYLGLSQSVLDNLGLSQSISVYLMYLGQSWAILSFLGLSWTILDYLGLSHVISSYLVWAILGFLGLS